MPVYATINTYIAICTHNMPSLSFYLENKMNTLKSLVATTMTCSLLTLASFNASAMDKEVEAALIDVCKSTLTNNVIKYKKVASTYHLKDRAIASKVMCNGENIIDFASEHGAEKTAARLERSIKGRVDIIDIAKINVKFEL